MGRPFFNCVILLQLTNETYIYLHAITYIEAPLSALYLGIVDHKIQLELAIFISFQKIWKEFFHPMNFSRHRYVNFKIYVWYTPGAVHILFI